MTLFEEGFNDLRKAIAKGEPDSPSLLDMRDEVVSIVKRWESYARATGKEKAENDCWKILAFIKKICP